MKIEPDSRANQLNQSTDQSNQRRRARGEYANFYERLPRFVDAEPLEAGVRQDLPTAQHSFRFRETELSLAIIPARIFADYSGDGGLEERQRLPGATEQSVEAALRRLAVADNPNFDAGKRTLFCSLSQIGERMAEPSNADTPEAQRHQIETAMETLANVTYQLKRGGKHYYFHAFKQLERAADDDEGELYYRIGFAPIFFNDAPVISRFFGE